MTGFTLLLKILANLLVQQDVYSFSLLAISYGNLEDGKLETKAAVTFLSVITLLVLLLYTEDKTKVQGLFHVYDIILITQDARRRNQVVKNSLNTY